MGGLERAPQTPQRSSRPGTPGALLDPTPRLWGPRPGPPNPPALVTPRDTRGAPRSHAASPGASTGPQTPQRSSRPGTPGALLDPTPRLRGPGPGPMPQHSLLGPSQGWGVSGVPRCSRIAARKLAPNSWHFHS